MAAVAAAGVLVAHNLVLAIASVIYLHWRLTGRDVIGSLVTALVTISIPGLLLASMLASEGAATVLERRSWHLVAYLLVTLALLGVVLASQRFALPGDPLMSEVLLGGVVSAACLVVVVGGPSRDLPSGTVSGVAVLRPFVAVAVAAFLTARGTLPSWGRVQLATGIALLVTGQCVSATLASGAWSGTSGLVATVAGAGLLCATSLSLVRASAHERRGQVAALEARLAGAESAARPDDVAEIVGVLLHNAARHGGGVGTAIEVRTLDETVKVVVSDRSPGPAPEVRQRLYDWGVRGPDSAGQGIGLHIARELAERQGGYLHHEDGLATKFVLGLPLPATQPATQGACGERAS